MKKIILISAVLFINYILIFAFFNFPKKHFVYQADLIDGFLMIIFCLYFFRKLFTKKSEKENSTNPAFWAISGMLILFGTTMPLYTFMNWVMLNSHDFRNALFAINYIIYAIFYASLALAISYHKRNGKESYYSYLIQILIYQFIPHPIHYQSRNRLSTHFCLHILPDGFHRAGAQEHFFGDFFGRLVFRQEL